ncbi:uncharacterized protein K02A2.6-like [Ixodes scapularis]|uniref:uncharacterized protein K02A2.6-like n=1 Tax=Ixodes scapularis TaxID=6945 RepID=UPI001A9E7148|nr:uncharacterized protein K02A2.6-like [Ixodes scapularis]
MGIVKTKQLLRTSVCFLRIDMLVEPAVQNCIPCQASTPISHRDPVEPTPLPYGPWENLRVQFAGSFQNGKYLLILIDEYSRFPLVGQVASTDATSPLQFLRRTFVEMGIPKQVKSDNGPPFNSSEFKEFAAELVFKHHRATPLWPEANNEAERFVRTLTKAIKPLLVQGRDWMPGMDDFLMCYRATPRATPKRSSYELLFGRQMQTILPRPQDNGVNQDFNVRQDDEAEKRKS